MTKKINISIGIAIIIFLILEFKQLLFILMYQHQNGYIIKSDEYAILAPINYPTNIKAYNAAESKNKIISFIISQFDQYRKNGINLTNIEELYNLPNDVKHTLGLCRIQIINNEIYADTTTETIFKYCSRFITGLSRITKNHSINDVDFILFAKDRVNSVNDEIDQIIEKSHIFLFSKNLIDRSEKNKLLLPDPYIVEEDKWPSLINRINNASDKYSWNNKIHKIFWRGCQSGLRHEDWTLQNYTKADRMSLVGLSGFFPQLINAAFSSIDFEEDITRFIMDLKGFSKPVPEEEHLQYKYLISLDGNTCAWMRVPWIMLSNSVLLKQETNNIQMFYQAMEPFVHYIPISKDLTDIFEKSRWLQNHDEEAKLISENATKFIMDNLNQNAIDEYIIITLNEYSKLQQSKVIRSKDLSKIEN